MNLTTGLVTTFFLGLLTVGVVGGIQIMGSGVNTKSLSIAFGASILIGLLFSIKNPFGMTPLWDVGMTQPTARTQVGFGLATNLITAFAGNVILEIIATFVTITIFMSGIIALVTQGGE